jgi:predicted nucleic acid-binding protein
VTARSLEAAIPPGRLLVLDTSVVLAYLAGSERASRAASWVVDDCIGRERNPGALSMITVTETLVRPFQRGPAALATAETFLRHFGRLQLVDVTYAIAREAARLRAGSKLRTPDALVVATALISGATVVITNDMGWRAPTSAVMPKLAICYLGDHLPL